MGYTTSFTGRFQLDQPLTVEQATILENLSEGIREGHDFGKGFLAPSNYCQWIPTRDGGGLEWDGGEKFYGYEEWLVLIIGLYLEPWGRTLSGRVEWHGEEPADQGVLHVKDNQVQAVKNVITKPDPAWKIECPEPQWEPK